RPRRKILANPRALVERHPLDKPSVANQLPEVDTIPEHVPSGGGPMVAVDGRDEFKGDFLPLPTTLAPLALDVDGEVGDLHLLHLASEGVALAVYAEMLCPTAAVDSAVVGELHDCPFRLNSSSDAASRVLLTPNCSPA